MQGVVLAAGQGKRLQPLTGTRSKAMMPIAGKPIVERVMELIALGGVDDFILVVAPQDREIEQYFQREAALQANVRFVYQAARKGMAHALLQAAPLINGDFFLSACDNLVSAESIANVCAFWQTEPRPNAILTLMPTTVERICSGATVGLEGVWVTRIIEKPKPEEILSNLASLPLYAFTPRILDYLPEVQPSPRGEYELQDAIQKLIARDGRVGAVVLESRMTLTNAADLLALNLAYLHSETGAPHLQPEAVGPHTHFVTPVRVESGVVIGAHCAIGPNVYLEHGCCIGNGAVLRDAVVLRGAAVADGETVVEQVIG
ncbi:MAG: NTP transferase domain-containing protein [Anaerolineae bacterium]|nr:NTP transferase domain-containing protein [Anaerolineae bacterium]